MRGIFFIMMSNSRAVKPESNTLATIHPDPQVVHEGSENFLIRVFAMPSCFSQHPRHTQRLEGDYPNGARPTSWPGDRYRNGSCAQTTRSQGALTMRAAADARLVLSFGPSRQRS
jgi:hypothetical protein